MKKLLVISNHNPYTWTKEQRLGWDEIIFEPFPYVPPNKPTDKIIEEEVKQISKKIREFYEECEKNGDEGFVNLQGEFTICCYVFQKFALEKVNFVFPTTERVVEEVKKEDGSVEKKTIFRFVMWR